MRPLSPDGDGAVNNDPRPFLRLVNAVDNLVDGLRKSKHGDPDNMLFRCAHRADAGNHIFRSRSRLWTADSACGFGQSISPATIPRSNRRRAFRPHPKLAGICGKAFHISSPSFRIYRIKGKGCFSLPKARSSRPIFPWGF